MPFSAYAQVLAMSPLKPLPFAAPLLFGLCLFAAPVHADIYRCDNGEVIPGTKGIAPGSCRWNAPNTWKSCRAINK